MGLILPLTHSRRATVSGTVEDEAESRAKIGAAEMVCEVSWFFLEVL